MITGTLGQLSYEGEDGAPVKMYLARPDDDGQPPSSAPSLIPVPEFFWKVVHDPAEDAAVVFVGLNDPYFAGGDDPAASGAVLCPDVCDEARWFLFRRREAAKGYTYCCSYQDFAAAIEWAPPLDPADPGLLKNFLPAADED